MVIDKAEKMIILTERITQLLIDSIHACQSVLSENLFLNCVGNYDITAVVAILGVYPLCSFNTFSSTQHNSQEQGVEFKASNAEICWKLCVLN